MSDVRESIASSKICIVGDSPRTSAPSRFSFFSGYQWELLRGKMLRAGIVPEQIKFLSLKKMGEDLSPFIEGDFNIIIPMGERPLQIVTGKKSIDKWHLSPLEPLAEFRCRKAVPTFDVARLQKQHEFGLYVEMAFARAAKFSGPNSFPEQVENFNLNPSIEETMDILFELQDSRCPLSVDVETGHGQINTVGFAWTAQDAIAINVLPDRCGSTQYFELWKRIAAILEDPEIPKTYQNFIYDTMYFSAYGIQTRGIEHDTMWAQKFLWPEFDANLGNVGRFYTERSYWKDDGKVESEEGKKKDWGNIRDWTKHYTYNCRDTTGTFEAKNAQRVDLDSRGNRGAYQRIVQRMSGPILEMISEGIPFSQTRLEALQGEVDRRLEAEMEKLRGVAGDMNPRSPKQVKAFLTGRGFKLPKLWHPQTKSYKESTSEKAMKKLRLKHPEAEIFSNLMEISHLNTAKSRYLSFKHRDDGRIRFSLNGHGTETGRWSSGTDPFGMGFNIQTIPRDGGTVSVKSMMEAPEGWSFINVDLKQAESRFVAYDAPDLDLIRMLEDPKQDLHKFVASHIFGIDPKYVTGDQRDLGKKSGHGANYNMKEGVFVETCLQEMDVVLSKKQAKHILDTYHSLFPGIRKWHSSIRQELRNRRKLCTPLGRERYFYGRFGEDMFREAYAYRPQSTIPDITNSLLMHLWDIRGSKGLPLKFLCQVHDSLLLLVRDDKLRDVLRICATTEPWHPKIELAGGRLIIPTEASSGKILNEMEEFSAS